MKYHDYLQSTQWKQLADSARKRANYQCEFCGGDPDHVHHVNYPKNKNYDLDCLENLVVACESCHSKSHGIRGKNMNEMVMQEFHGRKLCCTEVNGEIWVLFEHVARAVGVVGGNKWGPRIEKELNQDEDWMFIDNPFSGKTERFLSEEGAYAVAMRFGGNEYARSIRKCLAKLAKQKSQQLNSYGSYQDVDQGIGRLRELTDLLTASVQSQIEQKKIVDQHEQKLIYLENESDNLKRMITDYVDADFDTAKNFLISKRKKIDSSKFGMFCSKQAKDSKASFNKNNGGWFDENGQQLSKKVPVGGQVYQEVNKWRISWLERCLAIYELSNEQIDLFK